MCLIGYLKNSFPQVLQISVNRESPEHPHLVYFFELAWFDYNRNCLAFLNKKSQFPRKLRKRYCCKINHLKMKTCWTVTTVTVQVNKYRKKWNSWQQRKQIMGYPVLIIASLTPFWPREKGSQNFLKLTYVVEALGPQH